MWFTGIDWADTHHDVVVLDHEGALCLRLRIDHTAAGVASLITRLRALTGPDHQDEMICVLETKTNLLVTALLKANFVPYPINPKTVDRWRPVSGAKSDLLDAYTLAKIARSDWRDLRPLHLPEQGLQELQLLVRDQQGLIGAQTRLANQLRACLKAYYPVVLDAFDKGTTLQKSLLAFIVAYPTPEQAHQASVEELTQIFKQARHPHPLPCAQRVWPLLQQPHLEASAAVVHAKSRLAQTLVAQLHTLMAQIHDYDLAIEELYQQQDEYEVFASLPNSGKRLGPRLLAELAVIDPHEATVAVAQQLAGTAPVTKQSGNSRYVVQRQACSKTLRATVYLLAAESCKNISWARAYHDQKKKQGKKSATIFRGLANTWLRIIWAMRRKKETYQEDTFVQAQARHAPAAA
ncbi:IS110 family transposase [Dictyobacter vulcani]|uniref:IS110 family transposase n=1 Tax=Dictyobacter vulcani TaxID=2607529 RepID=A0A5J4KVE3_9CHLR|nr:IS110 family transposase [Dictyobacter vulcani]GER90421.1 IS110 family transposase [Dictyobacter vulcani]GER91864.1 IS110 family transposase [Dictyobacter vulcani]